MSTKQIIESSPAIKSTTICYSDRFMMTCGGIVNIYDNLAEHDCDLILETKRVRQVQFATKFEVSEQTLELINDHLLIDKAGPTLRLTLNGFGAIGNLSCLEYLPNAKSLAVDMLDSNQIDYINRHLRLKDLAIGGQGLSIKSIAEQRELTSLFVFGKLKDIEVIGGLINLNKITFSKMTLKNLDFLVTLKKLNELNFLLGSATNYERLPDIGSISRLSFNRVRQLSAEHLFVINRMKSLKELAFDSQPHLYDLEWLTDKTIKTEVINCKNFNKQWR